MAESPEFMPVKVKDWDGKFAQNPDEWFFGREPSEMARLTLNYWRSDRQEETGSVLDLGCGEGRDAVFFSEKGFQVTAVDGAASAIGKLERLAEQKGVKVFEAKQMDIRSFRADRPFDIVLAHNSIQFLGSECLEELRRIQEMTAPGGLASVSAFTREAESLAGAGDLYRFDHNELKFRFEGWRLLIYGEHILWREPAQTYLSFAHIIAQKPE
jgi:SAM-dependent methyltransferase